jgi:hypothetical protein
MVVVMKFPICNLKFVIFDCRTVRFSNYQLQITDYQFLYISCHDTTAGTATARRAMISFASRMYASAPRERAS